MSRYKYSQVKDNRGDLEASKFQPDLNDDAAVNVVDIQGHNSLDELNSNGHISDTGTDAGSTTQVTLLDIVLLNDTNYKNIEWVFSCFRNAIYEIVHIDDVTDNILKTIRVGDDQNTHSDKKICRFTTGSTGSQILRVRARNLSVASTMDAYLGVDKVQ